MVNTSSGAYELFFQISCLFLWSLFFSVLFIALGIYYYFDASRQLYQEMSARAKIQAEDSPDAEFTSTGQPARPTGDSGVYAANRRP